MDPDTIRQWLCGPMVAVATPFNEDFSLDLDALHANIRFMIDHGVKTGRGSLLVGGAGGEHPMMNAEERKAVMDASMDAAQGEVPVFTSVQHTDTRVIVDLARHASKAGLQGVQLGPTYYYPPSEADVFRLFQMVSSESDATIMIYHTPWHGLTMSIDLLRRLAEFETVRALKWAASDPQLYQDGIVALADTVVVIDNQGEHIWSHILGARGFITHLSGFWPEYPGEIWDLLEQRDYAAVKDRLADFKWDWTRWIERVERTTGGEGPFIKAAMEAVGLRVGPPRPPSVRPDSQLLSELRTLVASAGVPMASPLAAD